jgi:hypothetical protein
MGITQRISVFECEQLDDKPLIRRTNRSRAHSGRDYSHALTMLTVPLCPANKSPAICHRPLSSNYFRCYVSISRHCLRVLIIQFPTNCQQCTESLRKTDKKGLTCASTCLTAAGLRLPRRYPRRPPGARSIPESR